MEEVDGVNAMDMRQGSSTGGVSTDGEQLIIGTGGSRRGNVPAASDPAADKDHRHNQA
jgi:hypothetical protein